MSNNPTSEKFIPGIIANHPCVKHNVLMGDPCYTLYTVPGAELLGVCDKRAKRAGYDGKISPESIRTKSPNERPARPERRH